MPGLAAKPVVDIMVGVRDLSDAPDCIEALRGIGYEYVPEFEAELPNRRYFRKFDSEGARTHQIHLVERSDADWWERHVGFRDYLRAHPETAREYEKLKLDLASRFRDDWAGYMEAKSEFILAVERRSRAG